MEKRLYKTLVKANQKLGNSEYVRGRISGIEFVICEGVVDASYATRVDEKGHILTTKCTADQYERFRMLVAEMYPGLCEFDYVE